MIRYRGDCLAVVGAQYGSEGKGVIVAHIANRYKVHVRVGGPNAGHTFHKFDKVWKMQSLPCGWINPNAKLVIGAGAVVDMALLEKEIREAMEIDDSVMSRVYIDPMAGVLDTSHHAAEGGVDGELHSRIGSTGEGVGAARLARISRDPNKFKRVKDANISEYMKGCHITDTVILLNRTLEMGENVLLEGTQGSGLSLIHGPWPYVTSADTNAAQLAADCGLAPRAVNKTLLVARSYPIRVAGNSGPLSGEVTWGYISEKLGKQVEERTTVTKKVRRVGHWDEELFMRACSLNNPTEIALTFADYLSPEDEAKTDFISLSNRTVAFVHYLEMIGGAPVKYIGTGGMPWTVIER